jgi:hypothetical protein
MSNYSACPGIADLSCTPEIPLNATGAWGRSGFARRQEESGPYWSLKNDEKSDDGHTNFVMHLGLDLNDM